MVCSVWSATRAAKVHLAIIIDNSEIPLNIEIHRNLGSILTDAIGLVHRVQTGSGAGPQSLGVKRPERDADHAPPSLVS
jgi:hypothetical protein